jgi:ABC-2 type transport system ATP-binding protein
MSEALITVERLEKTFYQGLLRKRVDAVRGVSFEVMRGEIFGFVGPNGSGKTTTIKMITGLITPSGGKGTLFGQPLGTPSARANVGFLPENPYIHPYVTPREYVEMCGSLSGLRGKDLRDRSLGALERTGVAYAADRQARRLSKGMLQRTGLAAALVADPEMLILDEPMSGLDPVGRKEVRDIILEDRRKGRTIFFSTHILADVETICDRVTVLKQGEAVVSGPLRELLRGDVLRTEIVVAGDYAAFQARMEKDHKTSHRVDHLVVEVQGEQSVSDVLRAALDEGLSVVEVTPRRETLEDLFLRRAIAPGARAS